MDGGGAGIEYQGGAGGGGAGTEYRGGGGAGTAKPRTVAAASLYCSGPESE